MKKSDRDRRRRARQRLQFEQLKLQANLLCESHSREAKKQQEILHRMLNVVLELLTSNRVNDDRRDELVKIFESAGYVGDADVFIDDEGMIFVHGNFDVRDLSKKLVWGSGAETLQEVGGTSK